MEYLVNALRAWILIFSALLLLISIITYKRTKNKRILIVSIAFTVFFVKGIVLFIGLFTPDINDLYSSGLGDFLDGGFRSPNQLPQQQRHRPRRQAGAARKVSLILLVLGQIRGELHELGV